MNIVAKRKIEEFVNRVPNGKILFAVTSAIILGAIIYLSILFFLSR